MQVSASLGAVHVAVRLTKALAMSLTGSLASFLCARLHIDRLASWGWRTPALLDLVQLAASGSIEVG